MPLKLAIDLVPVFDGKSISLTKFLKQCKIADASVHSKDKLNLLTLMRNKIVGFADKLMLHKKEPKTLDDLIKNLKTCFAKTFDVDSTHAELKSQKQGKYENTNVFGARINELLERALEATKERFDAAQAVGVSVLLNHAAITGFSLGLRDRMISTLLNTEKFDSLEEAINVATKLEQKNETRNALFGFNQSNNFLHLNNPQNSNDNSNTHSHLNFNSNTTLQSNSQTNKDDQKRCYNCQEFGHVQRNCPKNNKNKVLRCYTCNEPGHKQNLCPKRNVYHFTPYKLLNCDFCKRKGHLENECKFKNNNFQPNNNSFQTNKNINVNNPLNSSAAPRSHPNDSRSQNMIAGRSVPVTE